MPAPAPLCAALFSLASAVLRPGEDRREEPGAVLSFWCVSAMLDAYVVILEYGTAVPCSRSFRAPYFVLLYFVGTEHHQ